jgi:hypothetical protein
LPIYWTFTFYLLSVVYVCSGDEVQLNHIIQCVPIPWSWFQNFRLPYLPG